MPAIRSFSNPFEQEDFTEALMSVPNVWNMTQTMGLFSEEGVTNHLFSFQLEDQTIGLIKDQKRGGKRNVNTDNLRKLISYQVPHFPLDDYITPDDVQGKMAFGATDAEVKETWQNVLAKKLFSIRRKHSDTLEFARMQAITQGTVYAPNGTVMGNYYTDFGVTRTQVDFGLLSGATDVISKNEQVIAGIQDNIMNGDTMTDIVGLVSPEFFSAYIAQAGVKEAYRYFSSAPFANPLRERLGVGKSRVFEHGGLTLIEYRGTAPSGQRFIPAGEAYFFPVGTEDLFRTYFSPANKFDYANTVGQAMYAFVYMGDKNDKIEIETEQNFINLIRRPQAIIKGIIGS